jgi:Flp pilus assembly pilin Flp
MIAGMRSARGQATVEYVALAAIVALVLVGAVAITPGGLGTRIVHTIRLGLCRVSGTTCPALPRERADLPPCPLSRATRSEDLGVKVTFVKLGQGFGLEQETYSDGHVVVRFADDQEVGLTGSLGPSFAWGDVRAGVDVDLSVSFASGRAWSFPHAAAARRFVERYGGLQTVGGRVVDDLRRDCLLCRMVGWGPKRLPPPTESYEELGSSLSALAKLGVDATDGLGPELGGAVAAAIGLRHDPAGRRTVYFRLGGSSALALFAAMGASTGTEASGTVGVTLDRRNRVVSLRFDGAAVASGRRGRAYELETEVPIGSSTAHEQVRDVLRALAPAHVGDLPAAVVRAAKWARDHAAVTRREFALTDDRRDVGAEVGLGVKLGGRYGHGDRRLRLVDAQTRLPGLSFLPRADCLEAGRVAASA